MELRTKIGSINTNAIIEKKTNVEFKTFDINEYKEMFQQLVDTNYMLGSFEDIHWEIPDKLVDYPIILSFDIEVHYDLNKTLKGYTILRLISGRSPFTVYNELAILKKVILATNGFQDIKALESLLEIQSANYSYQGYQISTDVKRFVSFHKVENHEKIEDICNNISLRRLSRELPLFEDIMIFDDIINDYFRNYSSDETFKFLPIMIWWLLTNVLPMRPSEFTLIEKDCLKVIDHFRNPYRISVPRIKNESSSPDFVIRYDLIEIDRSTYELLSRSIQKIKSLDFDSEYLFPVELLTMFRKRRSKKKNSRMNRRDFDYLKKEFYEKVVEGIYGQYGLERIKSGDTRHFAIINMCLQGFNMLSIARMAGQDDIRSQYSYYSHAEHFAQSYVYRLAQRKNEIKVSKNIGNGIIGWRRFIYDKGKSKTINNVENIVGRVQYGTCMEQKDVFPNSCIEYCEFCSNYIFNPSINEHQEAIKWLLDSSKTLEIKIRESIALMKEISTNLANSLRSSNDDTLKTTSRSLLAYMDMKATVDSRLMEAKIYGNEEKF
ncbi:site-specific integrase [Neobacillus muris]|uniref:site-specific integrase n=1 Tax=Neobacillus muris TaxID=2941334 RepID=UPI00203BA7B2|nr:site-specific integrase [Neobacillus muris]